MRELNVVISGFDHYDGVEVNPAVEVPKAIAEQGLGVSSAPDDPLEQVAVTVHAVSIPVSFAKAWPTLKETIEATKPNIVIATGLKHAARGVMLERCATNLMDAIKPDADNVIPRREPIDPNGPAAYWTRLPLRSILNDFTDDSIPATLSSDAGTFVCNSLFYNLLNWTATQSRCWADSSASLRSFRRIPASMVYHSTSRSPLAVMWCAKPCATISSPPAPTSSSPSTLCATPE